MGAELLRRIIQHAVRARRARALIGFSLSSNVQRMVPPLSVWLATAVLCGLFLSTVVAGFLLHDPWLRAAEGKLAQFAEQTTGTPTAVNVVALGDSKLRFALMEEAAIGAMAARAGVGDLALLRIDRDDATFDDFVPLLDDIIRVRPDLLLIQMELLVREPIPLREFEIYLHTFLRALMRGEPFQEITAHACLNEVDPDWNTDDRGWAEVQLNYEKYLRIDQASPNYDLVGRFVARAEGAGISVVLLGIPSTPRAEAYFYGPGNGFYPDVAAKLAADPSLVVWRFPHELADDRYWCDFTHLGRPGRDLFGRWMIDRIASTVRVGTASGSRLRQRNLGRGRMRERSGARRRGVTAGER